MPLRQPKEIEDYDLKAKTLRDNGWETYYHEDNWVMKVWWNNPKYAVDRMGRSTDAAYAGFIEKIVPLHIISKEKELMEYGDYLLDKSNDENLTTYLKETLPEYYIASVEHLHIIEGVLTEAYNRISRDTGIRFLSLEEYVERPEGQSFNYCIGKPWEEGSSHLSIYTLGVQVHYGTMEQAEGMRAGISKREGKEYKIYKLDSQAVTS